ncbi:MAG: DNA translocase FtsK 4TM domain-containing protein, partial [Elusimicrobiota bacterium]|nr:DNA translocase FtsK 4TM domain-containing protein [Elusimicrobiota bacterium]
MTAKSSKKKKGDKIPKKRKDIAGIILSAVSVLLIVSFITGGSAEATGWFGVKPARKLRDFLGLLRFSVPVLLLWWAISEFRHKEFRFKYSMAAGIAVFLFGGTMLLDIISSGTGGTLGNFINGVFLVEIFGITGTYIISTALILIALILLTDISVKKAAAFGADLLKISWEGIKTFFKDMFLSIKEKISRKKEKKKAGAAKAVLKKKQELQKTIDKTKKDKKKKSKEQPENEEKPTQKSEASAGISSPAGGSYSIPLELLKEKKEADRELDLEKARGEKLTEVLLNFDIQTEIADMQVGPAITRYEIVTPPGLKLSRIRNLSSNIAMALEAKTVRLLTPIPGKSTVGVEVPAVKQDIVNMRELITSSNFKSAAADIPYCLGKAIDGSLTVADLGDMPHLLLAGATGSGKSVAIHTLIISILYKSSPQKVKFLLIDPKRVELPVYNGVPHLIRDVITDSAKAVMYLEAITRVMDSRYNLMARNSVADISAYNKKVKEGAIGEGAVSLMPRIVVIIDELADLMVVAKDRVENAIVRISQMARAVGIHLVLATQRPSVDVITGLIKANLPARISFNVLSGVDSRTILDSVGAEKLMGKGDMLYLSSKSPQPERIQGGFITRDETNKIVDYLKELQLDKGKE